MQISILIEPIEGGRFRARAGEPFGLSVDGPTEKEAAQQLAALLQNKLHGGARLVHLELANGSQVFSQTPLHLDPLPDDDWLYQTMREAIAENRQRDDEAAQ